MIQIKKGKLAPNSLPSEKRSPYKELLGNLRKAKKLLCKRYDQSPETFQGKDRESLPFQDRLYSHQLIKGRLEQIQHSKCCYCEMSITRKGGDIEHFRPKASFRQHRSTPLEYPGYFWLAYHWGNLFLSCTTCNQRLKQNLFPLLFPDKRANPDQRKVSEEKPLLIHPSKQNPADYLTFDEECIKAINGNPHGETTIAIFKLDDFTMDRARKKSLEHLKLLLKIIQMADEKPENPEWQKNAEEAKLQIQQKIADSAEFAAMARAYIQKMKENKE